MTPQRLRDILKSILQPPDDGLLLPPVSGVSVWRVIRRAIRMAASAVAAAAIGQRNRSPAAVA